MSKRIKPSNLVANETVDVASPVVETPSSNAANDSEFKDVSLVGNGVMTAEAKEKLEKYDALEASVAMLSKEKETLEAKIAEYAERLAAKPSSKNIAIDAKLAEANSKIKTLEQSVKTLRDEADSYLVKISELTFENAKLTCQLDELSKGAKNHSNANAPAKSKLAQPRTDTYNPYLANGYSSWN